MRVSCRRSVSSQRSICSAQGESNSSLGVSVLPRAGQAQRRQGGELLLTRLGTVSV